MINGEMLKELAAAEVLAEKNCMRMLLKSSTDSTLTQNNELSILALVATWFGGNYIMRTPAIRYNSREIFNRHERLKALVENSGAD